MNCACRHWGVQAEGGAESMRSKAALASLGAAAMVAVVCGCGHTDYDVSQTGRVTKVAGWGLCLTRPHDGNGCFNAPRRLTDALHLGECVTVEYIPSRGSFAPTVDAIEPSSGC
jgi:hypothetical protein